MTPCPNPNHAHNAQKQVRHPRNDGMKQANDQEPTKITVCPAQNPPTIMSIFKQVKHIQLETKRTLFIVRGVSLISQTLCLMASARSYLSRTVLTGRVQNKNPPASYFSNIHNSFDTKLACPGQCCKFFSAHCV